MQTFTIEQIKNYLHTKHTLDNAIFFLSEKAIVEANEISEMDVSWEEMDSMLDEEEPDFGPVDEF